MGTRRAMRLRISKIREQAAARPHGYFEDVIARGIVDVLAGDLAGRFDGWEEVLEGVNHKLLTVVEEARNPDPNEPGLPKPP